MAPAITVRLAEERKLDRQLDYCRFGARKDNARVIIERTVTSKNPHVPVRRVPILEITPDGDVREVPAPTLKHSLADAFPAAFQAARRRPAAKKAA